MSVKPWIQTYSGLHFNLLDPKESMIDLEDIAHALSQICRFTGHTKEFYSVAQHCYLVSFMCEQYPREGQMHDSAEAYFGDVSSPLKKATPFGEGYKKMENNGMRVIANRFDLHMPEPDEVKVADMRMLFTEQRDLLLGNTEMWFDEDKYPPYDFRIIPWGPEKAKYKFLERAKELKIQ